MSEITPGTRVTGVYCGVSYTGLVKRVEPTPLGDQVIEITVSLTIVVNSIARCSIASLKNQITNTVKETK